MKPGQNRQSRPPLWSLAVVALLALAPAAAHAQAAPSLGAAERQVAIGVDGLDKAYKEFFRKGAPEHDREDGWTVGVAARAGWIGDVGRVRSLYAAAEYAYDRGQLDYVGTAFNSATPIVSRSGLEQHEARFELGRGFSPTPRLLLIPVLQAGYHVWDRNLGPGESETYRHVLLGAAVRADYALTSRLTLRTRLGVAETVSPEIEVRYGGVNTVGLGDRPVYQGAASLDYAVSGHIHAFAGLDYSHYGYGRSGGFQTSLGVLAEPNSRSDDLHLNAGVGWSF